MTHKYVIRFLHPETNELHEDMLTTETKRTSKVLKVLAKEVEKKYNIDPYSIKDLEVYAIR